MAVSHIVEYPDPILRETAEPVHAFNATTASLITDLIDTLHSSTGIGLCAPQLGYSAQILAMDLSSGKNNTEIFVNPQILSKSGFAIAQENCLSIPGVSANVMRAGIVHIKALDKDGHEFNRTYEGMHAICLQHEIDHLEGKLFIDRVSALRSLRFRKTLERLKNNSAAAILQHC